MSTVAACPACTSAAPLTRDVARRERGKDEVILSLPHIHCAGCIAGVERRLRAMEGVVSARVNLSKKRVAVRANDVTPEQMVAALEAAGFVAHPIDAAMLKAGDTDDLGNDLLLRLAVAGFAMMNVMLFSVAVWSGASSATLKMFHWIAAGISVPALLYAAQVFFRSAWSALRVWRLNMDVPISLAIILAAGLSLYETAQGGHQVYFDAALSLTFFLLVGRYLDHRTRKAARAASKELSALESPRALRLRDGEETRVNVSELRVGDLVRVSAGMRIPLDGEIVDGTSDIDRSLITGESLPVGATPGMKLAEGEMNLTAPLVVRVTAIGADTTLRRMAEMIETAESARNRYTALADRAAQIYAPAVHLLALATFLGWMVLSGDVARSLSIAISVLIITCPCALGLAVPAVMTVANGRLFRQGLLVKDGTALERLADTDRVVFDKTGTLTDGHARLDLEALSALQLSILAGLCRTSEHPVSRAIASAIPKSINAADLQNIREVPGCGIEAVWQGCRVRLGSSTWAGADASPALAIEGQPVVTLPLTETLRKGALEAVDNLQKTGYAPHVLSGDTSAATQRIGTALGGIPTEAEMMPEDKAAWLEQLQSSGHKVLMVGDGLNDTAALSFAHASMSPGSALDASRAASDIVILGGDLAHIPDAIATAKSAKRRVLENFAIAAGYNCIAVPVAVLGFASPLSAAIAMSASSITVLINALRVR